MVMSLVAGWTLFRVEDAYNYLTLFEYIMLMVELAMILFSNPPDTNVELSYFKN